MNDSHSDALVFFGATGDLAYKKIFPALQAMVKRGHLNVPVIGVAKAGWNLDQPEEMEAYERVLGDAMAGDCRHFARQDYVEEAWRIVDPVLKADTPVYGYEKGSWGPSETDRTVLPEGGWHNPTAAAHDAHVVAHAG